MTSNMQIIMLNTSVLLTGVLLGITIMLSAQVSALDESTELTLTSTQQLITETADDTITAQATD